MLLTTHEGKTFTGQTVYISGQAFVRCHFVNCTLLLRETIYHLDSCTFDRCNWHIDWILLWGSPESLKEIKALVTMLEQFQMQQLPPEHRSGAATAAPSPGGPGEVSPAPRLHEPMSGGPVPAPRIQGVRPPDGTSST